MKVTVCQLNEGPEGPRDEWSGLVEHVLSTASEVVLLPEMPFHAWLPRTRQVEAAAWEEAVASHDHWLERLDELAPAAVLGTRPVTRDGRRLNQAFVHDGDGCRAVHDKAYLPDEDLFWEASWYERGDGGFEATDVGPARVGFLICTEMWFTEHARAYAADGVQLLASPRATLGASVEKWLAGGRAAAVTSGAYCLSSNRGGIDGDGAVWSGTGWIIEPDEGEVLARTSVEEPFVTRDIDLSAADAAKETYPRYVEELC